MDEYTTESATAEAQSQPMGNAKLALIALATLPNIVPSLQKADDADTKLAEIAHTVIDEYEIDEKSREKWLERAQEALKLAMLTCEAKNYPWKDAANINFPLLTVAMLQFNARAYPAIVQGNRVVKTGKWGRDPRGLKAARGERVSEFMSYQLLAQQPEWEEDTDRMLIILPGVGSCFRKAYYDPSIKRNTTRLVTADRLVVNYWARSIEEAPRVTEMMWLYPYEIQERIRSGRFIEFDYGVASQEPVKGKDGKEQPATDDKDGPHLFLEQHRLLDLDNDGYPEPYIVTVHKQSQKVCRIVANWSEDTITVADDGKIAAIRKQQYYVKYEFVPSPDGGFYGMGFGTLTKGISGAIDTLLNQMVDAGHQSVVQGGFVSSQMGIKEKKVSLSPGEFRIINASGDVRSMVLPMNFPGPSAVLFNLLGLLIDAGKDITGVKDVLTGEGQGKNASPTTTMALIEQGLQQFTAIYKRIHRSLKKEYGILAGLNKKHVDPKVYADFFDEGQAQPGVDPAAAQQPQGMPGQQQPMPGQPTPGQPATQQPAAPPDPKADFNEQDMDILPVSDPSMVSTMQKMAQADFVMQMAKENPAVDMAEATRRAFEAGRVEKVDELIKPPPPPAPDVVALAKRGAEAEVAKMENEAKDSLASAQLKEAQTAALSAKTPADVGLIAAKTEAEHVKMEDATSRLLMEHGQSQQPEQTGPTPFEVKQHDDQMAIEAARIASAHEIGLKRAEPKPVA